MDFRHVRIDESPPCGRLAFCETTDLTGNGLPDVIVGGLGAPYQLELGFKRLSLRHLPITRRMITHIESNIFWYENPGWSRHDVATSPDLSVGSTLVDLTDSGTPDLIVGENAGSRLYWFEAPPDPRQPWRRRLITDAFEKYHDTAIGDVDGDGDDELVILSQRAATVAYFDLPADPTIEPWPSSQCHVVTTDLEVEGAAVADVDGDGQNELIAGPNVFDRRDGGWHRTTFDGDWRWTRVAVADLNGDGQQQIVLSEGDRPYHDGQPGRIGIIDPIDHEVTVLDSDLHNPHTLQLADFDGTGAIDIYTAEMGLDSSVRPRHLIYRNRGDGTFDRTVLASGVPTHEAKTVDLTGNGSLDIVGKSYTPQHHVDAWLRGD